MAQLVQTLLSTDRTYQVAFLPDDNRVRVGTRISLKGDDRQWEVKAQFARQDVDSIQRGWGLDLPKNQRTER